MRFSGFVGFGEQKEFEGGVWRPEIIERKYVGDITRVSRRLQDDGKVNADIVVSNLISIVADKYANEHFFAMEYVRWAGAYWIVTEVTVERPRLILRLGGVYSGPTADGSGETPATP